MRRILTARQQAELLSPWRTAAPGDYAPGKGLPLAPDVTLPGNGLGLGTKPVLPPKRDNVGEDTPWSRVDWRNADDYGAFHSTSRPPMSSDIPHPSELLDPKRHADRIARAAASEDPINDPYGQLNGTPWTFEDLVQNHISHHDHMTPQQAFQGKVWYPAAHDSTKDVAQKTIGDHERTVAADSALSPVKDWDLNNEQMIHTLLNHQGQEGYRTENPKKPFQPGDPELDPNNRFRVKAPDSQNQKARDLMRDLDKPKDQREFQTRQDYIDKLSGPKTSSFFNNILDDTPLREPRPGEKDDEGYYQHQINPNTGEPDWRYGDQDVTADTHHARVQTIPHGADLSDVGYDVPPHFSDKFTIGGKDYHPGYDLHARASAEAARRINAREQDPLRHLKPKQTQAGPWVKFKDDVVRAGVSPNTPEPGTAPKTFDPEKPSALKGPYPGEQDQPRYQRDLGDWWTHPDRPQWGKATDGDWEYQNGTWKPPVETGQLDMRRMPNYMRRRSMLLTASSEWLDSWIATHYPHRADVPRQLEASHDVLSWVDQLLGG